MSRTNESETEILLGNKQLLGIFFVVAILLGVAFTGGYMVGRSAVEKAPDARTPSARSTSAAETHAVPADSSADDHSTASSTGSAPQSPDSTEAKAAPLNTRPLGSPPAGRSKTVAPPATADSFTPERGQTFLQVAAVGRDEAEAIADVLHKKGFRAHAVPKPGSSKFYRVLIGPIRDTADLSSTRDSLRKTGFREVIVQKYQ
jgi:cell division septation protein DedD